MKYEIKNEGNQRSIQAGRDISASFQEAGIFNAHQIQKNRQRPHPAQSPILIDPCTEIAIPAVFILGPPIQNPLTPLRKKRGSARF